jgi:23S rRNA (uracil1939-C5)-methyltransferase/tRNA (uracil-5-)-methyltransferase
LSYADELHLKERQLRDLLSQHLPGALEVLRPVVPSPRHYHYRHRLDLKLQKTRNSGVLMGYTPVSGRGILEVDACPIGMEAVSDFLPRLKLEAVARLPLKYRQASLVVRTGDDGRVLWGGIGRRSNRLSAGEYLWTEVGGRRVFYSLDTFFQANLSILPELFRVIRGLPLWQEAPRFLDLYGGVGLFSVGLMDLAGDLVLIENSGPSAVLAAYNFKYHGLPEDRVVTGSVEENFGKYLNPGGRPAVAMVDPPRAGLSAGARHSLAGARHLSTLLYLSCHPESLANDLNHFTAEGWNLTRLIPFDFFPRTRHLETLAVLEPETPGGLC